MELMMKIYNAQDESEENRKEGYLDMIKENNLKFLCCSRYSLYHTLESLFRINKNISIFSSVSRSHST